MPISAGLYYFEYGAERVARPPIILIHGAGGHHLFWPPQMRRLHDQRIFAPDLPGHGKSAGLGYQTIEGYSGAVLQFLQALGLNTAVLVGHSMGAAVALDLAVRFPRRVLALALVGAGARLRVSPQLLQNASEPATFPKAVRTLVEFSFGPGADPRLRELGAQRLAEARPPVLYGDLLACDAFDARGQLSALALPTLVVCGAADRMTPSAYSVYLEQNIVGARLEIIPRAGHMVMLERPDLVAEILRSFLGTFRYQPGK